MVNYFIEFGSYPWYMYYILLLHDLLLDEYHPPVMLSLDTQHDILDLVIITLRECSTRSIVMYTSYA